MATLAETKQDALEMLGVVEIGQSAESQHDTRINTAYNEVYEDLKEEGLATWAVAGTIPNKIKPHLVAMMAKHASISIPVSDARLQRIILMTGQNNDVAKRNIRSLVIPKYESLSEPDDY